MSAWFGGNNIGSYSNIVFTNGNLDPWSAGGVLLPQGATLPAYIVMGGAHHLDLRAANPADPYSVIWVRQQIEANMQAWLFTAQATGGGGGEC